MILVGIDIAKDKHECFIRTLEGTVLHKSFSIANNLEWFDQLYDKILFCNDNEVAIKLFGNLNIEGKNILGDKAYGANAIRLFIAEHNALYPRQNLRRHNSWFW